MSDIVGIENRARIARVTCGWKKPALPLDAVRRYWRDVHSPAIARRAGVWDYRHYQFEAVRGDLLAPIEGIERACPQDAQLMWTSDVRYLDDAGLRDFGASPGRAALSLLLADIELIVERSTTYRALGDDARTILDATGLAMPQGSPRHPQFAIFIRRRASATAFHAEVAALASRWAETPGVLRVRLSLFEAPDMESERKAGYPVKTHPPEQQYQAWIDLVVADPGVTATLTAANAADGLATQASAIHVYPVHAVYTSVYAGHPTLVGLRGFPAWEAIEALGGAHQRDAALLEWMYGGVAHRAGMPGAHP